MRDVETRLLWGRELRELVLEEVQVSEEPIEALDGEEQKLCSFREIYYMTRIETT